MGRCTTPRRTDYLRGSKVRGWSQWSQIQIIESEEGLSICPLYCASVSNLGGGSGGNWYVDTFWVAARTGISDKHCIVPGNLSTSSRPRLTPVSVLLVAIGQLELTGHTNCAALALFSCADEWIFQILQLQVGTVSRSRSIIFDVATRETDCRN